MTRNNIFTIFAAALSLFVCISCGKDENFGIDGGGSVYVQAAGHRAETGETRRVLIFYECGFNNLYNDLYSDVNTELNEGFIPTATRKDNVILVYSKFAKNIGYSPVKSYLRRLYRNNEQEVVSDTLKVFDESVIASSEETMREVLNFIKTEFPARSYGMVFSSHGSGWLPAGYLDNPTRFENEHAGTVSGVSAMSIHDIPSGDLRTDDPYADMVRSIGNERGNPDDYEMSIDEFVSGIPFHLDYLLFDMCFTAGVEVAYALKDVTDHIGTSPAEVLSYGMFDYTKIADFLIGSDKADLEGLFKDSFEKYDNKTGDDRSSTVNLVRTDGIDNLASVCSTLFEKYRNEIAGAPAGEIQGYHRMNRHYFYDLEDVFVKCGASEGDLAALRSAMDACVVYKNATPFFFEKGVASNSGFKINTYSGFSVYLPCKGTPLLDSYYKKEAWNKATGLVR